MFKIPPIYHLYLLLSLSISLILYCKTLGGALYLYYMIFLPYFKLYNFFIFIIVLIVLLLFLLLHQLTFSHFILRERNTTKYTQQYNHPFANIAGQKLLCGLSIPIMITFFLLHFRMYIHFVLSKQNEKFINIYNKGGRKSRILLDKHPCFVIN